MNSKQTSQSNISIKDNIITPQIKLVNTLNSIDFSNPLIFAENLPVGFSKTKKISEYFQHELIHIILGFDFKKISREFFVLNLQKIFVKKTFKKTKFK